MVTATSGQADSSTPPAVPGEPPPPRPARSGFRIDTLSDYFIGVGADVVETVKGNAHFTVGGDQNQVVVGNSQAWIYGNKFDQIKGSLTEHTNGMKTEKVWGSQICLNFANLDAVCIGLQTNTNVGGIIETKVAFHIQIIQAFEHEMNPRVEKKRIRELSSLALNNDTIANLRAEIADATWKLDNVSAQFRNYNVMAGNVTDNLGKVKDAVKQWRATVSGRLIQQASKIVEAVKDAELTLQAQAELKKGAAKVTVSGGMVTVCGTNLQVFG
jgi:hypothetical protein